MFGFFKNRKRNALRRAEFSPQIATAIDRNVIFCQTLSDRLRNKLEDTIKVLVAERRWEGCDGLTVTDEMRVTVAGHAAVLLLGTNDFYFDSVPTILLYPGSFEQNRRGRQDVLAGQAWQFGPIVLSWRDVLRNNERLDGNNVVIHEFAHHLDGLDGEMGGSIPFSDRSKLDRWHEVSEREYRSLVDAADENRATLLNHYGAENRAEFFAVASECFFELPSQLKQRHPDLYELLCDFYQMNPMQWYGERVPRGRRLHG